jgi:hypothetical protein
LNKLRDTSDRSAGADVDLGDIATAAGGKSPEPLKRISGGLERGREAAVLSVTVSNSCYAGLVPGCQDSLIHLVPIEQK